MKYRAEYKTNLDLIFRIDNWIRLVGAILVVYAKFSTPSTVTNEYLGTLQSDVLLIILGVVITIIGPDARKLLISKFGGEK
jgi:hypothetical protein